VKDKKDSFILKLESEPVRFMIAEKVRLTYHFLKRTEAEYNYLKREWERLRGERRRYINP